MENDLLQVTTTADDKAYAEQIAGELIAHGLVACAQIVGPIESVYRWKGNIEHQTEWMCIAKTTRNRYPEVETLILDIHPYDLPEIVATPITAGNAEYLNWVLESVAENRRKDQGRGLDA